MIAPIASPIAAISVTALERGPTVGGRSNGDFAETLRDVVRQARADERDAVTAANGFAVGDPAVGIHEVVIAAEKANVSLRYATTLKNKLLESYRELMNTAV